MVGCCAMMQSTQAWHKYTISPPTPIMNIITPIMNNNLQ